MNQNPTSHRPKKVPQYIDRLPPCNNACPAGENIQAWLNALQNGHLFEAWQIIMQNNPLPACHGRVCYHPCESACNRKDYDESVSIHSLERFLGDLALQEKWQARCAAQPSGKKVLVIGAGPAGLSVAYHLRCLGHTVVIYEAENYSGGMMHSGIPPYRLPREILDGEIERIKNLGVEIELNYPVKDLLQEKAKGKFDAVFIGVGADKDKHTEIAGENIVPIYGAIDFLKAIERKQIPEIGKHLVVYGGGNTAIDVARSVKRLGVAEVTIVYRRNREKMPAFASEVNEALEENIEFRLLRTIKEIHGNTFTLEIMELNEQGKPQGTGQFEEMNADQLILALGQDPETQFLQNIPEINLKSDGTVLVDDAFMTPLAGIFAGGDAITDDRSVTIAVGHGKKAAHFMDAFLRDTSYRKPAKHEMAEFSMLHLDDATKSAAVTQDLVDPETRAQDFREVMAGINKEQLVSEAKRCFSCGNCFECDGCYNVCPVKAIAKLGPGKRYRIDLKTCIGCGKCFRRCPCGAIRMTVPEDGGQKTD